jgi:LmbE family N-acetylglucosaminyl deacetylase
MVMAHPDDEVIFGWPIFHTGGFDEVVLLTLADNSGKRGKAPVEALSEVCDVNEVGLIDCPRQDSNFYRLPPRGVGLTLPKVRDDMIQLLANVIATEEPDYIFTHNPMGEYGHGDHRFVFNLVSMFRTPLLLTDICFKLFLGYTKIYFSPRSCGVRTC